MKHAALAILLLTSAGCALEASQAARREPLLIVEERRPIFHAVWYSPIRTQSGIPAVYDEMTLVVERDWLELRRGNQLLSIPFSQIIEISFEPIGPDFSRWWVSIHWGDASAPSYAAIADGCDFALGANSSEIFDRIVQAAESGGFDVR